MNNPSAICIAMKKLLKEQELMATFSQGFQYVCSFPVFDTIPFTLHDCELHTPFSAHYKCIKTPYFRLEKIDIDTCCASLTLLEPVDMEGNPVDICEEFYSLRKTKSCIIVNINCFCTITPLPPKLVDKKLPTIEPKK
ncbi:hypothetical protein CSV75_13080 [Sporosarcina sp. P18a]|uniref:CotY/CotZ family spore coat protein n=1 Tax=Sporosarcina sp. P18a TaxID=2048259 RepID=UPI000C172F95|nr:CotY/CotZ family spore coat protein [Sporosarcina sp. P18a]PIC79174.1 hypothetical protein CSV75_13080 [Sporosarcina sp. P18a]